MAKTSLPNFPLTPKEIKRQYRFWDYVAIGSPDECWEWQSVRDARGYGRFYWGRQSKTLAHRIAWSLANGRQPKDGLCILHSCDNPPCVNPSHLSEGTQYQNMQDMCARNRKVAANRTHCKNGHLWTTDRLREYRQPTGRITLVCMDCHRDRMRKKKLI